MEREWPLIGRGPELEAISRALASPAQRGLILAGPAGVGKTRLATACMAMAEEAGFSTARVVATRAVAGIALGALAPLLHTRMGGVDRSDLLRHASSAIVGRGGAKPVLLVIDDGHHLDDASATLVHQIAAAGQALVVTTLRAGEPVPDPITSLWKDGRADRIDVRPLDRDAARQLVETVLGGPLAPATADALLSTSGGNALFLRELVLGSLVEGTLQPGENGWQLVGRLPITPRLIEVVESRLGTLTDDDRAVLELVAFAAPIGIGVVEQTVEPARLERLERLGFLGVETDMRRMTVRLAHPMQGEVLRAAAPLIRTRAIHRTLADAVENLGARRREDRLQAAVWRLASGGRAEPEDLVLAAQEALDLFNPALAVRLARAARDAGGGFDAGLVLSLAEQRAGRPEDAERTFSALHREARDDLQRADVACRRILNLGHGMGRLTDAMALAEEAETTLTLEAARDEVATTRLYFAASNGRPEQEVLGLMNGLLDRATGRALVGTCLHGFSYLLGIGRGEDALEVAETGLAAVRNWQGPRLHYRELTFEHAKSQALIVNGRLAEGEALAAEHYRSAVAAGSAESQGMMAWTLGMAALARGQLKSAASRLGEAAGLVNGAGSRDLVCAQMGMALAQTGDTQAATAIADLDDRSWVPFQATCLRAHGWMAATAGDLTKARRLFLQAAGSASGPGLRFHESEALHDLARTGGAAQAADRLAGLAAVMQGPVIVLWAAHAAALRADDPRALRDVSAGYEGLGMMLLAAEAAAETAAALRRRGAPGQAVQQERRSGHLAAVCEGARTPALLGTGAAAYLSRREREVAQLAVSGLSNKDIAERLGVSKRTVDNQLQRVYEKLGLAGRPALANALGSHPA